MSVSMYKMQAARCRVVIAGRLINHKCDSMPLWVSFPRNWPIKP